MKKKGSQIPLISTELSLPEAMQLVGDNHAYQYSRLIIIAVIILGIALLNNQVTLKDQPLPLLFLIASGTGQVICPVYLSLRTNTLGLAGSAILAAGLVPLHPFLQSLSILVLGVMSRGFFVGSLLYLTEIGGRKFGAFAMMVIFGVWAGSQAISSIESWLELNQYIFLYIFVLLPILTGSRVFLDKWQPSPAYLLLKKLYPELKQVLTQMSRENQRPEPPYSIVGEHDDQNAGYQPATYKDLLFRRLLRKITVPLWILWIYREYIYYASYMLIPQVSSEYGMVYIMVSISETLAVVASYWIRLYIKRVNAIASTLIAVLIVSLPCSFTTVQESCRQGVQTCTTKTLYYIALTVQMFLNQTSRFGMSLLALLLVSYTLEVYPSNVRRMGFATCLGVSSVGSILMPWLNQVLISWQISGFLTFVLGTGAALYFLPKMQETYGKLKSQTLEQLQNSPETSLRNWALLNFQDQQ